MRFIVRAPRKKVNSTPEPTDWLAKVWQLRRLPFACSWLQCRRDEQLIKMNPLISTRIANNYRNSLWWGFDWWLWSERELIEMFQFIFFTCGVPFTRRFDWSGNNWETLKAWCVKFIVKAISFLISSILQPHPPVQPWTIGAIFTTSDNLFSKKFLLGDISPLECWRLLLSLVKLSVLLTWVVDVFVSDDGIFVANFCISKFCFVSADKTKKVYFDRKNLFNKLLRSLLRWLR